MVEELKEAKVKFEPAPEFIIEDLETLKVLADPLRLRLLELMGKPRTVKQIAADLDIPPTKLYYHVNQLEQKGLIVTVDTRIVSGIIEKRYQVAAKGFRVKQELLSPGSEGEAGGLEITTTSLFESTKAELFESVQAGIIDMSSQEDEECSERSADMFRGRFRLQPQQAIDFQKRMKALVEEFRELSHAPENQHAQTYRLLNVWFPTSRSLPDDTEDTE
jgi:DNA-binding transcriptional ArsR family regulator